MTRLTILFILISASAFGQTSKLYRADRRLIADTTYQIDEISFRNAFTIETVLLSRIYNTVKYPEIARENRNEGVIIVRLLIDSISFQYKIIKSDNDYLRKPIDDYFTNIDQYVIDMIKPMKGRINFLIPIEFKIQKDRFDKNLLKYGEVIIESYDIARQANIIKH